MTDIYDFDKLADGIRQIRDNRRVLLEAAAKEEEKEKEYLELLRASADLLLKHGELERVVKVFESIGIPLVEVR
jgi:hypothetical protein